MNKVFVFVLLSSFLFAFPLEIDAQCKKKKKRNATTGWDYNSQEWGGFERIKSPEQITGPGLLFIQGGTFDMGVGLDSPDVARRVTVSSFYIDALEVSNKQYRDYVEWIQRRVPSDLSFVLPDTVVWERYLGGEIGEKLSKDYFRLPAFDYHPVVGVNFSQVHDFCKWRTDRVNEQILIDQGAIKPPKDKSDNFSTDAYLSGLYEGEPGPGPREERRVRFEDGILLPSYRLPTEAEWEFAATALVGIHSYSRDERVAAREGYTYTSTDGKFDKKLYEKETQKLWKTVQKHKKEHPLPAYYDHEKHKLPKSIFEGEINEYGVYNMNDNVSEWVQDVYRPYTHQTLRDVETHELNPYRGNIFTQIEPDSTGVPKTKLAESSSIKTGDNPQFYTTKAAFVGPDGKEIDYATFYKMYTKPSSPYQIVEQGENGSLRLKVLEKEAFEKYQEKSKQNEEVELELKRVCKGANFGDELNTHKPSKRVAITEFSPNDFPVGFRCAMTRIGSPRGNRFSGGNQIRTRKKKRRKYR